MLKRLIYLLIFIIGISLPALAQDDEIDRLLSHADALMDAERFNVALNVLNLILDDAPDNFDAYQLRALAYLSLGDLDSSIVDFGQIIELDPENPEHYLRRALLYRYAENYEDSLADYAIALEFTPDNADIYVSRAQIYQLLEDNDSALLELSQAIEVAPDDNELYMIRAGLYTDIGEDALAALDYLEWLTQIEVNSTTTDPIVSEGELTLPMAFGQVYRIPFDAESGDRLGLSINSRTVDSLVVLLSPDGEVIAANDDGGQGLNAFLLDVLLPVDGTYTLLVGHARGGWNGRIRLTMQLAGFGGI